MLPRYQLIVALAALPLVVVAPNAPAQVADVLMLETTLGRAVDSVEDQEAAALGLTVDVASAAEWAAMSAADFADYRAIVLGDPFCGPISRAQAAIDNRDVWGPQVDGNVVIFGTDPAFHQNQGGRDAIRSFINYAVDDSGNLISNGDFNAGTESWTSANLDSQGGLKAFGGNAGPMFTLNQAGESGTNPILCQDVTGLEAGREYYVRGQYRSFAPSFGDPNKPDAFAALLDDEAVVTLPRPDPATGWTRFEGSFVAAASEASVCFEAERGGDDSSFDVDNLAVVPVASGGGATGAYIALSCYGGGATVESLLDPFGTFTVLGGSGNQAHVVADHPALEGLTDEILANWGASVHERFTAWPDDFLVLATALDFPSEFIAPDGTNGTPYAVARGEDLRPRSDIDLAPEAATQPVGGEQLLTATVDQDSGPVAGTSVTFEITEGPNTGVAGEGTTDAQGVARFSYSSNLSGVDRIVARFVDSEGRTQTSNTARITWTEQGRYRVGDWPQAFDLQRVQLPPGVEGAAHEEQIIGYLAAETEGVQILDLTDPTSVQLLGTYRPDSCDADGLEVLFFADDLVYVPEQQVLHLAAGPCGVHVVDVSGVSEEGIEPVLLSSYDTPGWAESVDVYPGDAGEGTSCGGATTLFSYVADFDSLEIWDVSDAASPIFCGAIDTTDDRMGDGPVLAVDVFVDPESGDRIAAVATGDGARGILVNDPQSPVVDPDLVYVTPAEFGELRDSQDISVEPEAQFSLLPSWPAGLQLLSTDEETDQVFLVDRIETNSAFFSAAVCGQYLCATEGQEGLARIAFDGTQMVRIGDNIPIGEEGEWAWDLALDGCTAYVTAGNFDDGSGSLEIVPLPDCGVEPVAQIPDGDGDGVADAEDNCTETPNADQFDANLDGYGNACDADYDDDGITQLSDFVALMQAFGTNAGEPGYDAALDNDQDGTIQVSDFVIWAQRVNTPPGPSGLACAGEASCP